MNEGQITKDLLYIYMYYFHTLDQRKISTYLIQKWQIIVAQ